MLTVTVAQDGSGDFASIAEAVLAVPYEEEALVQVGPGIYREKLVCEKKDITLAGAGMDATRLVWNGGGKLPVYIAENVIQCILGEQVFGRGKVELKQLAHFLKLRHFLAAIRTGKRSRLNAGLQYAVFIQQTARAFVSVSACFGIEINPMFVGIAQKLCKFVRFLLYGFVVHDSSFQLMTGLTLFSSRFQQRSAE